MSLGVALYVYRTPCNFCEHLILVQILSVLQYCGVPAGRGTQLPTTQLPCGSWDPGPSQLLKTVVCFC